MKWSVYILVLGSLVFAGCNDNQAVASEAVDQQTAIVVRGTQARGSPQPTIGEINRLQGTAQVLRANVLYEVDQDSRVQLGDVFLVDADSQVKLEMSDDTLITLGEEAQFAFHFYNTQKSEPRARMSHNGGLVRVKMGKLGKMKGATFEIISPFAIIDAASNKTDFAMSLVAHDTVLEVILFSEGELRIENQLGSVEIVGDGQQTGASVTFGQPPLAIEQWSIDTSGSVSTATSLHNAR